MDGYIAQKKCKILEVNYLPGEAIQNDAVPPDLEERLIKKGFIVRTGEEPRSNTSSDAQCGTEASKETAKVEVPVNTKDGVLTLKMVPGDIAEAIRILQLNAEEAAAAVDTIEAEETLILIDALDGRKTVKNAVRAKAEATSKDGIGDNAEGEGTGEA